MSIVPSGESIASRRLPDVGAEVALGFVVGSARERTSISILRVMRCRLMRSIDERRVALRPMRLRRSSPHEIVRLSRFESVLNQTDTLYNEYSVRSIMIGACTLPDGRM